MNRGRLKNRIEELEAELAQCKRLRVAHHELHTDDLEELRAEVALLREVAGRLLDEFVRISEWADYGCEADGGPYDVAQLPVVVATRLALYPKGQKGDKPDAD